MTTLRRIFRHLAPKVMGYPSDGPEERNGQGSSACMPGYASGTRRAKGQTFRRRDPYVRFEGENELSSIGRASSPLDGNYGNKAMAEARARPSSLNPTWDARKGSHDDGDGEKAIILQTTSVRVTYD
ncbi:hypothetical protein PG996_012354 [Apiospora saccharicola]|uniref:Uncharacterized protein n=1 Tax=Apiospora saccharicola TaxID=335842 RepID=A0ABR1U2B7_9PEZI